MEQSVEALSIIEQVEAKVVAAELVSSEFSHNEMGWQRQRFLPVK